MRRVLTAIGFALASGGCGQTRSAQPATPTVVVPPAEDDGDAPAAPRGTIVTVSAPADGQIAFEVERSVAVPLETALTGIPGVTGTESTSADGEARVMLLVPDADRVQAVRSEAVERLSRYARDNESRAELEPDAEPDEKALHFTLSGSGYTATNLRAAEESIVRAQLLRVPGVVEVLACGGARQRVEVLADPASLAKIPLGMLFAALEAPHPKRGSASLRDLFAFASVIDIPRAVVTVRDRAPVQVRDVATVSVGHEPIDCLARRGGADVVEGIAQLRRGARSTEVARGIADKIDEMGRMHVLPPGMQIKSLDFDHDHGALPSLVLRFQGSTTAQAEAFAWGLGIRDAVIETRPEGDAADVRVVAVLSAEAPARELSARLAKARSALQGVTVEVTSRGSPLRDRIVTLRVGGNGIGELARLANEAKEILKGVPGLEVVGSRGLAERGLHVPTLDSAGLAQRGITRAEALDWLEAATIGRVAGQLATDQGRAPIVVLIGPPSRGPFDLDGLSLTLADGSSAPLSAIVKVRLERVPVTILRQDGRRFVELRLAVREGDAKDVAGAARALLGSRLKVPYNDSVTIDGDVLPR